MFCYNSHYMETEAGQHQPFFKRPNFWISTALAAFFLAPRLLTLTVFPIFNDEAIYTRYAQFIHADWSRYKYVSMQMFDDWKPPLQYWLGSLTVNFGNPLLMVRLIALAFSLVGLVGIYLFAKEFFGKREGIIAAALWSLCPAVLFYNNQFIAETFVFSLAPIFYWLALKAIQKEKIHWGFALGAILTGGALILLKQSGTLTVGLAALLPLLTMGTREVAERVRTDAGRVKMKREKIDREALFIRFGLMGAIIAAAMLLPHLVIPSNIFAKASKFNGQWVMSFKEIFHLPWAVWWGNMRMVADFYLHLYTLWAALLMIGFAITAFQKRSKPDIVLFIFFAVASAGVILPLKGFNDYIYNTAVLPFLILMLARTIALALPWGKSISTRERYTRGAILAITVCMLLTWGYRITLMRIAPERFLETSTAWMRANYLENWPSGFGVPEAVRYLHNEAGPGIVFGDSKWGNPRTSLEVFQNEYPSLLIAPIRAEFLDPEQVRQLAEALKREAKSRFVVFSSATANDERRVRWQANVSKFMCTERHEFKTASSAAIVVCKF